MPISVVIDHAKNPKASTGKFECVYQQTTTPLPMTENRWNTLQINGTALQLHLQLDENVMNKAAIVHTSSGPYLNIFTKLRSKYYSLNVIKKSDTNVPMNLDQDMKRDVFKSDTDINAKAEPDSNNYLDLNMDKATCAYTTRMELNALAKLDNVNNLEWNRDKDNDYSAIRNSVMTQTEPNAVIRRDSDHMNLSPCKDIDYYVTHLGTNIRTKPDDHMDLNPKREIYQKSDAYNKTQTHTKVSPEPNKDGNLVSNPNTYAYTIRTESNANPEGDNDNHLELNPDKKTCAYRTHIEPNAMAEPVNYDYLDLNLDKEISG